MPKLLPALSVIAFLLFISTAHAQSVAVNLNQAGTGGGAGSSSGSGGGIGVVAGGFLGGAGMSGEKGHPFSADVIDETDQFLADGNHLHQESRGKFFRALKAAPARKWKLACPAGTLLFMS